MDNGITDIVKIEVISSEGFERGDFVRLAERVADDWDGGPQVETTDYHKEIFIMNGHRYQVYIKDKSGCDLIRTMLEEARRGGVEQGRAQERMLENHRRMAEKRFNLGLLPFPPDNILEYMRKNGEGVSIEWPEEDS